MNKSRRFTSKRTAFRFAEFMGGVFTDLTSNPIRKSNYKVTYTKADVKRNKNKWLLDLDTTPYFNQLNN
tara:strand:+ start:1506 stop:1712 length:207 start_codon:yes stop_codon:yes gene_type:complete